MAGRVNFFKFLFILYKAFLVMLFVLRYSAICAAGGAYPVEHCLVRGKCESVVGEEVAL